MVIVRINTDNYKRGAGFLISDRHVLTCHHIVRSCNEVKVTFPDDKGIYNRAFRVVKVLDIKEDEGDICILEVVDSKFYSSDINFYIKKRTVRNSTRGRFYSYGFPDSNPVNGMPFENGIIGSHIFHNSFNIPQVQLLNSNSITKGYSGAPIIDVETQKVLGIIKSINSVDEYGKAEDLAFAVPIDFIYTKIINFIKYSAREDEDISTSLTSIIDGNLWGQIFDIKNTEATISKRRFLSKNEAAQEVIRQNLFEATWNPNGLSSINFEFKFIKGNEFVHASNGLTWEASGSPGPSTFSDVERYIKMHNEKSYGNAQNWRLPTLLEAVSIMSPSRNRYGLHLSEYFDSTQRWIWTKDFASKDSIWGLNYIRGYCLSYNIKNSTPYIRMIRES